MEFELEELKKGTRFTKLVENEVELKSYYQESLRLTRLLEHQSIGTAIVHGDGDQLLRYDDLLEEMKQASAKTLTKMAQMEKDNAKLNSDIEMSRLENENLTNEISHVRNYYEQLAQLANDRELEHGEVVRKAEIIEMEKEQLERKIFDHQMELERLFELTIRNGANHS